MSRSDLHRGFAIALFASAIAALATGASAAGNAETGLKLARQWCTECHVVDATGHGTDAAPAFASIAQQPGNRRWVRAWLQSPHPPMPNPNLSRAEIEDIIAYLDSLAAPKQ